MASNYSFSPVSWGGQQPGTSGTSHVNNAASKGDRNATTRTGKALKGSAMPQPLIGHTQTTPDFEDVNNFVAAVQQGDGVAASALLVYGASAVSRALATGRIAQGRRR